MNDVMYTSSGIPSDRDRIASGNGQTRAPDEHAHVRRVAPNARRVWSSRSEERFKNQIKKNKKRAHLAAIVQLQVALHPVQPAHKTPNQNQQQPQCLRVSTRKCAGLWVARPTRGCMTQCGNPPPAWVPVRDPSTSARSDRAAQRQGHGLQRGAGMWNGAPWLPSTPFRRAGGVHCVLGQGYASAVAAGGRVGQGRTRRAGGPTDAYVVMMAKEMPASSTESAAFATPHAIKTMIWPQPKPTMSSAWSIVTASPEGLPSPFC